MIPPPNVTGTLHMGHAFQHTLMDALTRYHRMRGDDTLWQPGTDHAGIATQMVVERQLNAQGQQRTDLTREALRRARVGVEGAVRRHHHARRCAGSATRWTGRATASRMDPGLSRAVIEVFVRLHDEGLIYRGKRLVNWDPVLLTALSDLEVQARGRRRAASGTCAIRWRTAAATSSSRPRARRPCSATPPSRCIPRMSATGTSSASTLRLPLAERD